ESVVWSGGEPLMIFGGQGVGKTTLAQQLTLARAGLRENVLGSPVEPDEQRVLYIAADRPRQAARSFRRMVADNELHRFGERALVHRGPLPFLLNDGPDQLIELAFAHRVGTIVIDSLKDVALDIATDETGGRLGLVFQALVTADIELCVLNHTR